MGRAKKSIALRILLEESPYNTSTEKAERYGPHHAMGQMGQNRETVLLQRRTREQALIWS